VFALLKEFADILKLGSLVPINNVHLKKERKLDQNGLAQMRQKKTSIKKHSNRLFIGVLLT
jgi:hypothetical protein